jgi:FMN-dependent NADH-azoreductase
MTRILRIDSSSHLEGCHSRELADYFQNTWCKKYPDDRVTVRDVVKNPAPHVTDLTIAGFYTPQPQQTEAMKQAIATSKLCLNQDLIVFS